MTDRDTVQKSPRISGETTRRSGVDRRQGLGRRIVRERRREQMSVDEERRSGQDRRLGAQEGAAGTHLLGQFQADSRQRAVEFPDAKLPVVARRRFAGEASPCNRQLGTTGNLASGN